MCVLMQISPTKSNFSLGKILVALDTYAKKMNPPSIVLGGGVGCTVRSAGSFIAYSTLYKCIYISN